MPAEDPAAQRGPFEDRAPTPLRVVGPPRAAPLIRGQFRGLAVLSLVVGALLLLENFGVLHGVHRLWPVFPAFLGLGLTLLFFHRGRRDVVLLGIGVFLLGVSVLFFVLNLTTWTALSWAWPVFIALVGLASIAAAPFGPGARHILFGSGSFLVLLAALFLAVFGVSPRYWPLALILFGLWTLFVALPRNEGGRWALRGGNRDRNGA